jgi:hypothetical protein
MLLKFKFVSESPPGMGFQKLKENFSLHTYEISFVTKLGGFGEQTTFSAEKHKVRNVR